MADKKRKNKRKKEETNENLKGAFASVLILGAFLVISWFAVYILYLSR